MGIRVTITNYKRDRATETREQKRLRLARPAVAMAKCACTCGFHMAKRMLCECDEEDRPVLEELARGILDNTDLKQRVDEQTRLEQEIEKEREKLERTKTATLTAASALALAGWLIYMFFSAK